MRHRGHAQLFTTWLARRDEASFRALCERHASVVYSACVRLGAPDADEAAQAVFIVLAQRPEAVGDPTRLVGWLLGTARRVVANQRRGEERRRRHEQEAAMEHARQRAEEADPAWAAARPLLDEALASLSAPRREAMVRFYLEGRPQALVARELGCSVDAVKTRVHESLALLRRWFSRRGVTLGLATLATGLASEASAANPALVIACTKAGLAPTAAPAAAALAKGVAPVMTLSLTTATTAAAVVLGSSLVAAMVLSIDRKPAPPVLAPAPVTESVAAPALVPAPGALNAQTFWFGNTWGNTHRGVGSSGGGSSGGGSASGNWMQMAVDDFAVAGDRIYTISGWDQAASEAGIYSTAGEKIGMVEGDANYADEFHASGFSGGRAVAVDANYVFYAMCQDGQANNQQAYGGISRYTRDGKAAGWPGAVNRNRLALFPGSKTFPTGLAIHAGVLYLSDPLAGRIRCFDTTTMVESSGFACANPGRLAIDSAAPHDLWVIDTVANQVRRIGRDGRDRDVTIRDCRTPIAVCIDVRSGDVLVADGALDRQQIRRYRADTGAPVPGGHFGKPIYAGVTPGKVAAGSFFRLTGIQTDADGSLYVSSWDYGAKLWKFDAERRVTWVRQSSEFVSCADADPGADTSVFSAGHRYVIDYSKPPGMGWTDAAITLDPQRYPDDHRLRQPWLAMRMLRLAGKPVLFGKEQMSDALFFWRFDGEIAVPAAMYWPTGSTDPAYPPGRPDGPFLWRDANGDGRMQGNEYRTGPGGGQCMTVDTNGNIWLNLRTWSADKGTIARLAFTGMDQRGVPTWNTTPDRERPIPRDSDIRHLSKMYYDAALDRMYLGVWTSTHPHPGRGWEQMEVGAELQRFDSWTSTPSLAWKTSLIPLEGVINWHSPKAWSFEADYAFFGSIWRQGQVAVDVIRLSDGKRQGRLLPTADIGGTTGWLDMNDGIQSHRRQDGTYVVFLEEHVKSKGVFFQWRPK